MTTKIIDIHPHIISADTQRYPITPIGGKRSVWSGERPVSFEDLVAGMDAAGVAKAAIVHSSTTYGFNNAYVADVVEAHTDRFTGVFSVDMVAPDVAQTIRYWASRKLSGLRLFTAGSTQDKQQTFDDPRSFAGWDACADLGIPVAISMRKEGMPQLMNLIKRYAHVKIILDHLILPPTEEGPPYAGCQYLFDLAQYGNIYLKFTTNNVRGSTKGKATPETFIGKLVKEFGANRIAWGSNFPASTATLPEMLAQAKAVFAFLPQKDQDLILGGTALTLYPVLADK